MSTAPALSRPSPATTRTGRRPEMGSTTPRRPLVAPTCRATTRTGRPATSNTGLRPPLAPTCRATMRADRLAMNAVHRPAVSRASIGGSR